MFPGEYYCHLLQHMMIMLLSREMAVAVLRNAVRLSTAAARHGLSSRAVPLRTGRMLAAVPLVIEFKVTSVIDKYYFIVFGGFKNPCWVYATRL